MNIIDLATKTMQTAIKGVVDAIKTVVDLTKVKVDTIDTNVEAVKTTVDSTKTSIDTLLNGRTVKNVQRGEISLTSAQTLVNVPISKINPDKSIVISSATSQVQSTGGISGVKCILNAEGTVIKINAIGISSGSTVLAAWEVIEFY